MCSYREGMDTAPLAMSRTPIGATASTATGTGSAAGAVVAALAVGPLTMATEQTLPVSEALVPLLPHGALVRGRTIACGGLAAPSLALALVADACRTGSWLAVVDLPWLGIEAAVELGVPVERVVRIDAGRPDGSAGRDERGELWGEVLAAVLDGFELILTRVPPRAPAGMVRRLQTRLRDRGGVLVAVGDPGSLSSDVVVTSAASRWEGIGSGHGSLRARRATTEVSGRRVPRPRTVDLWLPGPDGGTGSAVPEPAVLRPRAAEPVLTPTG